MAISGTAVAGVAIGGIMLYAGFKGRSIQSAARLVLSGQNPSTATPANQITGQDFMGGSPGGSIPTPVAQGGSAAKNQMIAKAMCAPLGWSTGQNWSALVALWNRESGWNQYAQNPSSGAYGIPQSLPASKMGRMANKPFSIASAQIAWGLNYIRQRYGNPVNAWAHEESAGWY